MSSHHERVLVVEDDTQIRNYIVYALESEGLSYVTASTVRQANDLILTEKLDMILLDLGLPDADGIVIIEKLRKWSDIPIIVVSARDQDREKVAALDAGADDYITKPFSAAELLARIRVAFRHLRKINSEKKQTVYSVGDLALDPDKRLVYYKGGRLHLTPMEYDLLCLLFRNMGKVLTTGYILKEIWGVEYGTDTQALRSLMASLRGRSRKTTKAALYNDRDRRGLPAHG